MKTIALWSGDTLVKPQQKTLTFWLVVILMMALLAKVTRETGEDYKNITYPDFITSVETGKIKEVTFKDV